MCDRFKWTLARLKVLNLFCTFAPFDKCEGVNPIQLLLKDFTYNIGSSCLKPPASRDRPCVWYQITRTHTHKMVRHSACIFQTSTQSHLSLKRSERLLSQGSRWRRGSRSSFLTLDWPHRQHLSADARHSRVPPPLCNRRMKAIVLHFPVTMAWGEALSHAGTASVLRPAAEYISPRPWSCPLASEESGRRRWLQTRAERQYGNA